MSSVIGKTHLIKAKTHKRTLSHLF